MSARVCLTLSVIFASACTTQVTPPFEAAPRGPLAEAFAQAEEETGVKATVLMAVSWVETRWQQPTPHQHGLDDDGHHRGSAGLMGVMDNDAQPWVAHIAQAIDVSADDVRADPVISIRAGAHVLMHLGAAGDEDALREALAAYGGSGDIVAGGFYADEVLAVLDAGAVGTASTGEALVLPGRGTDDGKGREKRQALTVDSTHARHWVPAREGFFVRGRYGQRVDRVVIHTTEGSYAGAISWFRSASNPYQTSAHYVIRSSDGEITQMVREQDTAHHARDWNPRSIGIEHEAISSQPHWFTDAMYRASAALTRDICLRYGIPMDRQHIVGHVEVPGNNHTDPGPHFNWDYYLALVRNGEPVSTPTPPPTVADPCGGLDYAGVCEDNVLRWCENRSLREKDCTSMNRTCGWQNAATGNNCLAGTIAPPPPPPPPSAPPDPCNGETYAGRCDGNTLIWCEQSSVHTYQCRNRCGWQNDAVGHNCL